MLLFCHCVAIVIIVLIIVIFVSCCHFCYVISVVVVVIAAVYVGRHFDSCEQCEGDFCEAGQAANEEVQRWQPVGYYIKFACNMCFGIERQEY